MWVNQRNTQLVNAIWYVALTLSKTLIMRVLVLYSLVLATLLPTFSQWGMIAYFQINKEYITRVLCENRDKPQLHCDGKCYLAKRLKAQQDKHDKETTERVQQTSLIQLFCESHFSFDFAPFVGLTHRQLFIYLIASYKAPIHGLFRPPWV